MENISRLFTPQRVITSQVRRWAVVQLKPRASLLRPRISLLDLQYSLEEKLGFKDVQATQ